ncbi:MAG: hypothetical protein K9J12_05095 [Melioribacteraceae bacterium]|nr:hypothetical protein [Melioribacteraceae bacterium]MCF8262951.1 hypothetical protein [Melioribacteraceae bacterium]MCF8430616.1 hypothetical protein [Melioribacteraceae bacterium]
MNSKLFYSFLFVLLSSVVVSGQFNDYVKLTDFNLEFGGNYSTFSQEQMFLDSYGLGFYFGAGYGITNEIMITASVDYSYISEPILPITTTDFGVRYNFTNLAEGLIPYATVTYTIAGPVESNRFEQVPNDWSQIDAKGISFGGGLLLMLDGSKAFNIMVLLSSLPNADYDGGDYGNAQTFDDNFGSTRIKISYLLGF